MSNETEGFKVADSQRQSWQSIAAIWIGSLVCVPCLMVGGYLASGFPIGGIVVCVLLGYGIICLYMCLQGIQGCETGLPTVGMATGALGEAGARYLISLLLAVVCIGWFGVQAAVCGNSFSAMIEGMTGLAIPSWISAIIWGVAMVLTAMYGYKALKILNYIAIPALVLVIGYVVVAAVFLNDGASVIAAYKPTQPMPFVSGINLTVATFAVAGVISGDYSRFAKSRADVVKSTIVGVLPAGFLMLMVGAVSSIATGEYDITKILSSLGLPAIGLLALILATWTTNVTNAYSGGLAVSRLLGFDESKFKVTTGIAGGIGTILGAVGILSRFSDFLGILTAFVPPVAGVIIASYWIVGKGKPENYTASKGVNKAGILAFLIGAVVAYITGSIAPFFVAPINGIVVSIVLYLLLIKVFPVKSVTE